MTQENLSVRQYNDITFNVTAQDSSGDPIDLTGATIYFVVKNDVDDVEADALISKTCSITDAVNGKFQISIAHDDYTFDAGVYPYTCRIIFSDGTIYDVLYGNFEVERTTTSKVA